MKIEENIYAVMFLKNHEKMNLFEKNFNFSTFSRAPKRAQNYNVLKSKQSFDVEQIYISNHCDWIKIEENIYAIMFLKITKK